MAESTGPNHVTGTMSSGSGDPGHFRILALATNPAEGASTRFRVLQWRPYLEQAGFFLMVDTFFTSAGAAVLYQPGRSLSKLAYFLSGAMRRMINLARAFRTADLLFIHREAFPLGRKPFFRKLEKFPGPVVYDYDDAMFLPQRQGRGILAQLEDLETPKEVMGLSAVVLAGNQFLADYARRYAKRVILLPTCIDPDKFRPLHRSSSSERCVVGWIGSHSTAKYLEDLLPVLQRVAGKHRFTLYLVGSPPLPRVWGLEVEQLPWALEREVEDFQHCNVGIYPLWDDPWAQGKCGFKAIQFMACGVPVVAAAVGMNREVIQDGVNGFLAATEAEWEEKLGWLLSDSCLREKLGQAGRRTVEERYSLGVHAPTLLTALRLVVNGA